MIHFLTFKSILNRKLTTLLSVFSIALSVTLFLSIERIRTGAREGFTHTISKTDLIVGAKGGSLQLLLYTVFHIGTAVNNIKMSTFQEISQNPYVEWAIPISLGDSYKGFRVVATNEKFFQFYRYRGDEHIKFHAGRIPSDTFDVVLGSDVAIKEKLKVGDPIILSHGVSTDSLLTHERTPFRVIGIMQKTQTPIDTSVYINLYGMEAMHLGWESGVPSGEEVSPEKLKKENLQITQLTSFMLRLKSRIAVLKLRRMIDMYEKEPIMAIIPALSLLEMWQTIGHVEQILFLVSLCVLLVGLFSILIVLYTSINERRREMAILRSLGAKSWHIFSFLLYESLLLVVSGCFIGVLSLYGLLVYVRPWLVSEYSVYIELAPPSLEEWKFLTYVVIAGIFSGFLPAIQAYRYSLHDGLSIKY